MAVAEFPRIHSGYLSTAVTPIKDALRCALGSDIQRALMYKRAYLHWYIHADGAAQAYSPAAAPTFSNRYARVNLAIAIEVEFDLARAAEIVWAEYTLSAEVRTFNPVLRAYGATEDSINGYEFKTTDAGEALAEALRLSAELSEKLSRGDINV